MSGPSDGSVTPTAHQLRALAHPARLRMLGLLRVEGPATASSLAQRLGLNTGATSYHLRQLAQHGFIEDDLERGNGRERWWKARHTSTYVESAQAGDETEHDQIEAYLQAVVTVHQQQVQQALEERPLLPQAWRAASTFSDYHQRMTVEHAQQLSDRLQELLAEVPDDSADDAASFIVQLNAFPYPGQVAGDDTALDV